MEIKRTGELPETGVTKSSGGMTIKRSGDITGPTVVSKAGGMTISRVGGDMFDKSRYQPVESEGLWEGFIKPTAKSIPKVGGALVGGAAAFPLAGIAGGLRALLEGADAGAETIEEITSQPNRLLKTEADHQAISIIMKPIEWVQTAARFYGDKAYELTGSPNVGAATATAVEAIALLATPKLKSKLTKSIKSRNAAKVKEVIQEIEKAPALKVDKTPKTEIPKPEAPKRVEPKQDIYKDAHEVIRTRRAEIDTASFETNKFANELQRALTPEQLEAIPFAIEKTKVPKKLGRKDLEAVDLKALAPYVKKVEKHFQKSWEKVKKQIPEMSDKEIQNYVTHIWDIPKNKRVEVSNWFITQNKFLKKRYISTLKEGIEKFGLKPKTLNIAEIIKIHDGIANRSIANNRFVKKLTSWKDDGVPLITTAKKAPEGWVSFNHPAINKTIHIPSPKKGGPTRLIDASAKVHPDLVKPLQVVLESTDSTQIGRAYDVISGVLKKSNLSFSLFHHLALGETGVGIMGPLKTAAAYNPVKLYKALVKGEFEVFKNEAIARDAINHGLQLGASKDIPVAMIQKGLNDLAFKTKDVPLLNRTTSFMKTFNHKWDVALWDHLHDTLKIYAYENLVSKLDAKKGVSMLKQKREISQMVNDTFGGQNWDTLMVRPKHLKIMQRMLLSPDWTISTIRQALAPTGFGKIYKETGGLRKSMGKKFWLKAGIYFGVGVNMLNMINRKADMKENPQYYDGKEATTGNLMMSSPDSFNTPGNKTRLFMGRYEDGSERYVRWGKQFRELAELLWDETGFSPITAAKKKLGGKANPTLQVTSQIFTGASLSGFRNDDITGKKGWDQASGIVKTILKSPFPFSLKTIFRDDKEFHATDIAMPSGKGMSRYKSMELFKTAIAKGDAKLFEKTYKGTLQNNLPAFTLFKSALSSMKAEATKEINSGLNSVADARKKLKEAKTSEEKVRIARKLKRLHKEQADKKRGMKLLKTALKFATHYNEDMEK